MQPLNEPLTLPEICQEMDELGINVIAHVVINGTHHYNLSRKKLEGLGYQRDITVLKWARDEIIKEKRKTSNKKRLYNVR